MYLYRQTENALDKKDYDFLVDSFTYYSDVWRIVDNIGITDVGFSEFDNRYYAEEKPKEMQQFVSMDFYMVKSKHKDDGHVSKLQDRITNSMQASPYGQLADQDLPAWLNNVLTRAETCKGPNAKARFLQYILLERFNNTVHLCKFYPTDDNLYTERIKTFMSSIPQEYIEKWHCKPLYTAEETRQLRLNYIKDGLKFHPEMPKARDAALEAKYRQKILSVRPEAKIKMMVFASDATAEWQVKKTYAGVPTRRMKRGWAVVECPGQDFYGLVWFSAEQEYLGGGKYGASSVSVSVPPINDKMIYTEEWQFCKM